MFVKFLYSQNDARLMGEKVHQFYLKKKKTMY